MGLTGGIVDVGGLCDCLIGIHEGKADESILDVYSEKRMEKYNTVVNPISSDNFRRLFNNDPDTVGTTDEFFKLCHQAAKDEHLARDVNNVSIFSC